MSSFLLDSKPTPTTPAFNPPSITPDFDEDSIFGSYQLSNEDSWKELLLPDGAKTKGGALPLDLNTLLKVLDQHNNKDTEQETSQYTWQLVLIQGVLLSLLVALSITWACCCKKKCFRAAPPTVQEALRKLSSSSTKSKDFPPSYSQADLHTLAMSVHDYLYPPPQYPDTLSRSCDDLAYLDLDAGHRRLSKLSFSGSTSPVILQGLPASFSRQSSSSSFTGSESRRSSVSQDSSRKNSIMKDSDSRKSSLSQDSRRSSRVSFSEAVECSNGSFRRLSSPLELSRRSSNSSLSSDTSRKSSLLLARKLGLSQDALDQELRKKLEAIEQEEEKEAAQEKDSTSLETVIEIEKY